MAMWILLLYTSGLKKIQSGNPLAKYINFSNQGKFDKVANGYGKVVRTEKLKIELDKGISND
jgi:hypothetical protein